MGSVNEYPSSGAGRRAGASVARSGLVTAALLAVVLGGLGLLWQAHMHGRLHKMTTPEIVPDATAAARPGGQDVLHMIRNEHAAEITPHFSSALLLPGAGMAVLQAELSVPGHGPVPVFLGTEEASLTAQLDPQTLAPLPGLQSSPFSVRSQAPVGNGWGPATELVMNRVAQVVSNDFLPDGSSASATFAATPAGTDGRSPSASGVETKVTAMLSGRGMDLNLSATNHNDTPRALVITWRCRFAAPQAGLTSMSVVPPETVNVASTASKTGSVATRSVPGLIPLGTQDVHKVFTGLKYSYLSQGPEIQLRNGAAGYVLRLTAMTPSIRSMAVDAAKDAKGVALAFSTAGSEGPEQARTVVAPHETLYWHVRVDSPSNVGYTASDQ